MSDRAPRAVSPSTLSGMRLCLASVLFLALLASRFALSLDGGVGSYVFRDDSSKN